MYSEVRVISELEDGTVLVSCSSEACSGCSAKMFCNNKNCNEYPVLNPKKIKLHKDDVVEIFLPPAETVLSTLVMFGLPLVFFPMGFLLCRYVFKTGELSGAVGGLVAMIIAFGISALISSKNKKKLMPKITKIIPNFK